MTLVEHGTCLETRLAARIDEVILCDIYLPVLLLCFAIFIYEYCYCVWGGIVFSENIFF